MTKQTAFIQRVYDTIDRIPWGRVTTYGRIARAVGEPRSARMVGWAMMAVPPELDLPCHRVVNRAGLLSGGWYFGHPDIMRGLLLDEGIPFSDEYVVDLDQCVWDPWDDEAAPAEPFPPGWTGPC